MATDSADAPRERVAEGGSSIVDSIEFRRVMLEAQAGSNSAMGELIRSCQGYLLLVAKQELGSNLQAKMGASDAVQSALVQAKQHIEQFRGRSRAELLAWLRKILRNEINAAQRRFLAEQRDVRREIPTSQDSQQHAVGPVADDRPSPCTEAILAEEALMLRNALRGLPTEYRTIVLLRNWERLPFDEIGRRMNRTTDAVKKLWTRALARLQKQLNDEASREQS